MATRHLITELKGTRNGYDAWILAAGPSMAYVDPAFFERKWTIGVNWAFRHFPCEFVVGKELPQDAFHPTSHTLIVSRHRYGNLSRPETMYTGTGDFYVFNHRQNRHKLVDWSVLGTDEIIVSYSTITSAIHIAAYMGATNIILCGTDGGMLDGKIVYDGYHSEMTSEKFTWYRRFVKSIEAQTMSLRDRLREAYGCRVYMLNPFLNFSLEGHRFER